MKFGLCETKVCIKEATHPSKHDWQTRPGCRLSSVAAGRPLAAESAPLPPSGLQPDPAGEVRLPARARGLPSERDVSGPPPRGPRTPSVVLSTCLELRRCHSLTILYSKCLLLNYCVTSFSSLGQPGTRSCYYLETIGKWKQWSPPESVTLLRVSRFSVIAPSILRGKQPEGPCPRPGVF